MKRNKFFILGICTVLVALVSLSLVSGTWAKYTSTVSGEDTARVAKWAFTFNDENIDLATKKEIKFDLFSTVNDENGNTDDAEVKNGNNEVIIAPGTQGSFVFHMDNASEVTAKYDLSFSAENESSIPLQYRIKSGDVQGEWTFDIADLNQSVAALAFDAATVEYVIEWKWAFEGGVDAGDTTLGINGASVTVTASVEFEQVD